MNDLEKGNGCGKLARERRWETQSKEREREDCEIRRKRSRVDGLVEIKKVLSLL